MKRWGFTTLAYLGILVSFGGCALLRASPAPSSGFLPHDDKVLENRKRAPFHGNYIPSTMRLDMLRAKYMKVYLAPLELGALREKMRIGMYSRRSIVDRLSDAESLAAYFDNRFKDEFTKRGFTVLDLPSVDSLVWEIALVELEPSGAALNIAATAAGFFVPGTGLVKQFTKGSVAIEGIVRDAATGEIVTEFKDRESDKAAVITVRDFQRYSHARASLDEWAQQFAELASTASTVMVDDGSPITLNPF